MRRCDECQRRFLLTWSVVELQGEGRICSWACLRRRHARLIFEYATASVKAGRP